jgi:hypothetical protein
MDLTFGDKKLREKGVLDRFGGSGIKTLEPGRVIYIWTNTVADFTSKITAF